MWLNWKLETHRMILKFKFNRIAHTHKRTNIVYKLCTECTWMKSNICARLNWCSRFNCPAYTTRYYCILHAIHLMFVNIKHFFCPSPSLNLLLPLSAQNFERFNLYELLYPMELYAYVIRVCSSIITTWLSIMAVNQNIVMIKK